MSKPPPSQILATKHKVHLQSFKCPSCLTKFVTEDKCLVDCDNCNHHGLKKCKLTVDDYLNYASGELESANWHEAVNLPEQLFNELKHLTPNHDDKLELAECITKILVNNI